ncbi:unnamed protein product [Alternaria alternata]|jgi:acetyl esterase/lipase
MADVPVRPPFDVGYKNGSGMPSSSQTFDLEATRKMILASNINLDYIAQQQPEYKHVTLSASSVSDLSDYDVTVSLWQSTHETRRPWPSGRPVIYYIHGGG